MPKRFIKVSQMKDQDTAANVKNILALRDGARAHSSSSATAGARATSLLRERTSQRDHGSGPPADRTRRVSRDSMDMVATDGLGDWRKRGVARLAKPVPAAYPGGPAHDVGAPVQLTTMTRDARGTHTGFITPSLVALALSIALRAADRGRELHAAITFRDFTPQRTHTTGISAASRCSTRSCTAHWSSIPRLPSK